MSEYRKKWVKKANAWVLVQLDFDPKSGKHKQTMTWSREEPELPPREA